MAPRPFAVPSFESTANRALDAIAIDLRIGIAKVT